MKDCWKTTTYLILIVFKQLKDWMEERYEMFLCWLGRTVALDLFTCLVFLWEVKPI